MGFVGFQFLSLHIGFFVKRTAKRDLYTPRSRRSAFGFLFLWFEGDRALRRFYVGFLGLGCLEGSMRVLQVLYQVSKGISEWFHAV